MTKQNKDNETTALALVKKDVVDIVISKVRQFTENKELQLPADYSVENALKSAWLILQETQDMSKNLALEVCTKDSIANALLSMVVQGLNPGKQQGYFIVYGKKLTFQRSYFGSIAVAKMVDSSIADVLAEVIYKGDKVEFSILAGKKNITKHEQTFESIEGGEIVGAYALAVDQEGKAFSTVLMSMNEIKQSWKQSKTKPVDDNGELKATSVHARFTADMAKKTVINRLCKPIINSSSDSTVVAQYAQQADVIAADAQLAENLAHSANKKIIDVEVKAPGKISDQEWYDRQKKQQKEENAQADKLLAELCEIVSGLTTIHDVMEYKEFVEGKHKTALGGAAYAKLIKHCDDHEAFIRETAQAEIKEAGGDPEQMKLV